MNFPSIVTTAVLLNSGISIYTHIIYTHICTHIYIDRKTITRYGLLVLFFMLMLGMCPRLVAIVAIPAGLAYSGGCPIICIIKEVIS